MEKARNAYVLKPPNDGLTTHLQVAPRDPRRRPAAAQRAALRPVRPHDAQRAHHALQRQVVGGRRLGAAAGVERDRAAAAVDYGGAAGAALGAGGGLAGAVDYVFMCNRDG